MLGDETIGVVNRKQWIKTQRNALSAVGEKFAVSFLPPICLMFWQGSTPSPSTPSPIPPAC